MNDAELDALLRADATAPVADADFTQRLLERLPAQRRRSPRRARRLRRDAGPARAAQLMALSLAVLALGLLPAEAEALLPALSLLGLVLWWSLPQSGGALFKGA